MLSQVLRPIMTALGGDLVLGENADEDAGADVDEGKEPEPSVTGRSVVRLG